MPGEADQNVAGITPEKCDMLVQEFIMILKQFEGKSAHIYSKTSCDKKEPYGKRDWTVCMLFDPKKCSSVDSGLIRKPLFAAQNAEDVRDRLQCD
jgi:hypothetical protein